jgi:hypothetical protein
MKTDRELLELAAKAAGIAYVGYDPASGLQVFYTKEQRTCGDESWYWNPLTDDGDALRLAVKLEIDLSFYTEREAKVYAQTKHLLGYGTEGSPSYQDHDYHKELYKDSDQFSATRRAIVRAAAAIGETE